MKIGKSESLLTPHGNSYVWRYMSMSKFKRMMEDQSLFFCNAQRLSDQYEVTIPESTIQIWRKQLIVAGYDERSVEGEIASRLNTWQIGDMKARTLINCWSISPHESYALWKIYLGNQPEGVAIRTTVSRLKKSILTGNDPHPETVYLGQVRYSNHLKLEELSRFDIITTKKKFYDFEHELRLFIATQPSSNDDPLPYDLSQGRNARVDLRQLINRVYVSPFSNGSFCRAVESLLNSNDIEIERLRESEIRDT